MARRRVRTAAVTACMLLKMTDEVTRIIGDHLSAEPVHDVIK